MTCRRFCAVCVGLLAVFVIAILAAASEAPVVEDVVLTALRDVAEPFTLSAEDSSIVPQDPTAHPLRFLLLDGPAHGAILGDLSAVRYSGPHRATVELAYVPAAGYVGSDDMSFVAIDPYGNASATAAVQVRVVERRSVGVLAGAWDAEWTVNVQSAALTAFTQRLTGAYRVGLVTMKGIAEFQMESAGGPAEIRFDALRFEAEASVGDVDGRATLAFDPNELLPSDLFDYLLTDVRADLFGLSLSHQLFLTHPQTESYQTLLAQGSVGDLDMSNRIRFDLSEDCGFTFSRDDVEVGWPWCGVRLRAVATFTDEGFQSATGSVFDVPVPGFGWLSGGVLADLGITFRPSERTASVDLSWVPGVEGCVRVLGELTKGVGPGVVDAVSIYGLVLECGVAPGVRVRSATSFDPAKNAILTGQTDYFEIFSLSGDLGSCCGIPGVWSVATYFRSGSSQLFDWGMTLVKADVGVSEHLNVRLDLALRSGELGDPRAEFTIGWTARW